MAKEKAKQEQEQEQVENPQSDVTSENTQQVITSTEESDETVVDEVSEKLSVVNENKEPLVETSEEIANMSIVETAATTKVEENYEQIDFEEDLEFNKAENDNTEDNKKGPVEDSKYTFSESVLNDYLESDKQDDRIVQESRLGNFVSNRTREIYVPLSLFLK